MSTFEDFFGQEAQPSASPLEPTTSPSRQISFEELFAEGPTVQQSADVDTPSIFTWGMFKPTLDPKHVLGRGLALTVSAIQEAQKPSGIPEAIRAFPEVFKMTYYGLPAAARSMGISPSDPFGGIRDTVASPMQGITDLIPGVKEGRELLQAQREREDEKLLQAGLEGYERTAQRMWELRPEDGTRASLVFDVLTMVEKMVPAVVVGVATKNPNNALAIMFGQVYADKAGQMHSEGYDWDDVALHSFVTASIETVTEKVPFHILINKLGWSGVKRLLAFTVAEGLQEGASGLLQGLWEKGTIEPDKTMGEILRDAGYETVLGTLGAPIIGAPVVAFQQYQKNSAWKAMFEDLDIMTKKYKEMIESGEIQGPIVPQKILEARGQMQAFEQVFLAEAKEEAVTELDPSVGELLKNNKLGMLQLLELNTGRAYVVPEGITNQLASLLPHYQGKAHKPGEVIATGMTVYRDALRRINKDLADGVFPKEAIAMQELEMLAEMEAQVQPVIEAMIQDLVNTFAPGMKVYVGDAMISEASIQVGFEPGYDAYGRSFRLADGVQLIEINLQNMVSENGTVPIGMLRETVAHEFGHALINELFETQSPEVRSAVIDSYLRWLNKATKLQTQKQFLKTRHGFFWNQFHYSWVPQRNTRTLEQAVQRLKEVTTNRLRREIADGKIDSRFTDQDLRQLLDHRIREKLQYEFGMAEYTAVQAEKILSQRDLDSASGKEKEYFGRVNTFLKKLYKHYKNSYGYEHSYENFLRLLQAKASYQTAVKEYIETQDAILDRGADAIVTDQVANLIDRAIAKGIFKGPPGDSGAYDGKGFRRDMDVYNEGLRYAITLSQLAKLNPHIAGLQNYIQAVKDSWNTKTTWTALADERLVDWKDLGGKRALRLGNFLIDLTVESQIHKKRLDVNTPEFQALVEKWEVDSDMFAVYDLISQDFAKALDALEAAITKDAYNTFAMQEEQLRNALKEIEENFSALRQRNFFPLSRFGDYFVRVRVVQPHVDEGTYYSEGTLRSFEAFESEKAMNKRLKQLKNDNRVSAEGGVLTDTQRMFAGFPPQFLSMLKGRLGLTETQQLELNQLMHDLAPGQSYRKHLKHRKLIRGFSQDATRTYANYFMHFSNHIARIQHKADLLNSIKETHKSGDTVRAETGKAVKRDLITQWIQRHYDYYMNPGNEMANLRAIGFTWYLGFVPKSAFVNLTQLPLLTYPHLAARYGDAAAVREIAAAMRTSKNYWLHPKRVSWEVHDMLQKLKDQGITEQSLATQLAAVSEGSMLQRLTPGTFLKSTQAAYAIRTAGAHAAWMFHKAEQFNRRVTAIAAYQLARKKGASHTEAIKVAYNAVDSTQYEYSRWNRAEFMRHKKSILFLFWQYRQHTLFFLYDDPGRVRYLMMTFLLAGLSGLPFAEDAMDLYDFLARKMNKWSGHENMDTQVRMDLREFIAELGMNPDLIMHGTSRHSFGLSFLGSLAGIPIPETDISGSISMGRLIPGMEASFGKQGDFDERFSRSIQDAGGAVLSVPIELMRAIADDSPHSWKRWERTLPSVLKNASKSVRYGVEGQETMRDGAKLADFDLEDSLHVAEMIAQGLGFAPTRLQEQKELYYITKEHVEYYEIRRRQFLRLLDFARKNEDSDMEGRIWEEINKFNATVAHPTFTLTAKDIRNSLGTRQKDRMKKELGIYTDKRGMPLQRDIEKAYPGVKLPYHDEAAPSAPSSDFESFFEEPVR